MKPQTEQNAPANGGGSALPAGWQHRGKSYTVRLAGPEDEGLLRKVLRDTPTKGRISMAFGRDPDFFAPTANPEHCRAFLVTHNPKDDAKNAETGQPQQPESDIAGISAYSTLCAYFNKTAHRVSYLHLLRIIPSFRRNIATMRDGFAAIREVKKQLNPDAPCFTLIPDDNTEARRILEADLRHIPVYTRIGTMRSIGFGTSQGREGTMLQQARPDDAAQLAAFYAARFRNRQFAPVLGEEWFRELGSDRMPDLKISDFMLLRREGRVAGAMALWDQRSTRQNIINGYEKPLNRLRPFLNLITPFTGLPRLPREGGVMASAFLAFTAFDEECAGEPRLVESCVREALYHARRRGLEMALIGAPNGSELVEVLSGMRGMTHDNGIYSVRWRDESEQDAPKPDPQLPVWPEAALM